MRRQQPNVHLAVATIAAHGGFNQPFPKLTLGANGCRSDAAEDVQGEPNDRSQIEKTAEQ